MSGEIILYNTEDGAAHVRLSVVNGTVWLSQSQMADLFQTTPQNITQHTRAVYEAQELAPEATCKDYLQVQTEGALKLAERPVLDHVGSISHERMIGIVEDRYATFDAARKASAQVAAEAEQEQDITEELRRIEQNTVRARRAARPGTKGTRKP